MEQLKERKCGDCGEIIPIDVFLRDNPTLSIEQGKNLWEDLLFTIYCPECFLRRPEKPFRKRRGYNRNNRLKLRI
jgi:hypothetical protein